MVQEHTAINLTMNGNYFLPKIEKEKVKKSKRNNRSIFCEQKLSKKVTQEGYSLSSTVLNRLSSTSKMALVSSL